MATGTSNRKWAIFWLDSAANTGEENQNTQQKFSQLCDEIRVFETIDECQQEIRTKSKTLIILIVSGRLSRDIIDAVEQYERVSAMFVYCMDKSRHEQWAKEHPKVRGVHVKLDELTSHIQSHQNSVPAEVVKPAFVAVAPSALFPSSKVKKHPLDGYQSIPVFTIDKAVVSLKPYIKEMDHMLWMVKQNCELLTESLPSSEAAAIMLLTLSWSSTETGFLSILNDAIASGEPDRIKPWLPYVKLVFTAIAKLPTVKRIVYRGLNASVSNQYPKEKTTESWEFSLCTPSIKALEEEENFGKTGPRTLFTIECQSGKDISPYAFVSETQAILLPPGRRLKVVSSLNAGEQLHIVQMLEVEPMLDIE